MSRSSRRPNLDPATTAVIVGSITAATMATTQAFAQNPQVRFVAARVGDEVVIVKGLPKGEALDAAEEAVGALAVRETSRTFDTRAEAYSYAERTLGPVTRDLGMVANPSEIRAIKRRVLR